MFNRFCSADLPEKTAFYNPVTGKGFNGRIFMNGEETGNEGRAFAHILTGPEKGNAYQLPFLGRLFYENSLAHPNAGDKTIVISTDDSTPGQIYVYVGDKKDTGNPIEKAGLHGGKLFGVKVSNGGANYASSTVAIENAGVINGSFSLAELSAVETKTGAQLQTDSVAAGITQFARPEDDAWDTKNPNVFYFVTTGGLGQTARLYKLTLYSLSNPTGGSIELVIDSTLLIGDDGQNARSFDNIAVDGDGNVMVQEDPGNTPYIAKVWKIDPVAKTGIQIFKSDPARFQAPAPAPYTVDEENSGIIDVTDIVKSANWYQPFRRYYLGVMQAHYPNADAELVEGGQLYIMASPAPRH